jgi:acyl carrier protein
MTIPVIVPTEAETRERFARIVADSLRIEPAKVTPEARLDELGAESIDLVEISLEIENAFSILMPERTVLDAAREVLGDDVVVRDGLLSDAGSRLLRLRLPEVDPSLLAPGTPLDEVNRLFLRVDVWLRLIAGIVERSPRACERCGAGLVQGTPARVKCQACSSEYALPAGDDLSREWVRSVAAEVVPPGESA